MIKHVNLVESKNICSEPTEDQVNQLRDNYSMLHKLHQLKCAC